MDAISLIEDQHKELDQLFDKLKKAKSDQDKRGIFAELADKLEAHMMIEEQILYPAVKARSIEHKLLEGLEEHLAIRRVLADLLETPPSDPRYQAQVSVVSEQHEHHAHHEEEDELFPKVRKLVDGEELAVLGAEMLAMYRKALTKAPRRQIPDELEHAASL